KRMIQRMNDPNHTTICNGKVTKISPGIESFCAVSLLSDDLLLCSHDCDLDWLHYYRLYSRADLCHLSIAYGRVVGIIHPLDHPFDQGQSGQMYKLPVIGD